MRGQQRLSFVIGGLKLLDITEVQAFPSHTVPTLLLWDRCGRTDDGSI